MRTCLIVQHVAPEEAFAIAGALAAAGVARHVVRTFAGDAIPADLDGYDGLVVMGGPMSATTDDGFPTRQAELALVATALGAGVATLGVCLGAQLVAAAAGATVHGGDGAEVGWGPVALTDAARDDELLAGLPTHLGVLHWHGDTFTLPPGAVHLAGNDRYANQAFRVGRSWGLQFHVEVDAAAVDGFVDAFGDEADAAPGGREAIRREAPAALAALGPHRDAIARRFAELVAAGVPGTSSGTSSGGAPA